jgi:hypothetical protein
MDADQNETPEHIVPIHAYMNTVRRFEGTLCCSRFVRSQQLPLSSLECAGGAVPVSRGEGQRSNAGSKTCGEQCGCTATSVLILSRVRVRFQIPRRLRCLVVWLPGCAGVNGWRRAVSGVGP